MDQTILEGWANPDWFDDILYWAALGAEAVGIFVIVAGIAAATVQLLVRSDRPTPEKRGYRAKVAGAILLGLEFLIAADIITTVAIGPSISNLAVLGLIVLIRIVLSFALEVEIDGRWPWQKGRSDGD